MTKFEGIKRMVEGRMSKPRGGTSSVSSGKTDGAEAVPPTMKTELILADDETHALLLEAWRAAGAWLVGRYVIMSDHLHLFCAPTEHDSLPVTNWITFWKSYATRRWSKSADAPVWQRHFWDTQLRRSESYDQKWQYVVENPVRAGLVPKSEDWPCQGGMNILHW